MSLRRPRTALLSAGVALTMAVTGVVMAAEASAATRYEAESARAPRGDSRSLVIHHLSRFTVLNKVDVRASPSFCLSGWQWILPYGYL
ncbi:hypothetical protein GCM10020220_064080 [Nonomuraea rubra]